MRRVDFIFIKTAIYSTIAAGLAYLVGSSTDFIAADIAAIWALISVRSTFHTAMRDTFIQILGTVIGGLVGLVAVQMFGFNLLIVLGLVIMSFIIGYAFKMGVEGSVIIGFTIIVITSNAFSLESTESRIFGVMLGSLLATFASLFTISGTPRSRAEDELVSIRKTNKELLDATAACLLFLSDIDKAKNEASQILKKVTSLTKKINLITDDVKDAISGAKWSPLMRKSDLEDVLSQLRVEYNDANLIKDMINTIIMSNEPLPIDTAMNISEKLQQPDNLDTTSIKINGKEFSTEQLILAADLIASAKKIKKNKKKKKT
jgi:uncharacterized membrane protein YgaE (UPF0421/DUF939 family)